MSNQSFKVKNGLTLSPIDLTTLLSPQAGDLACDINDSNKIKRYDALSASWVEVGSGAAGDVDTLLVQDFDSASLSSFTQTGLTLITTNPLDGRQSARLIHQPLAGAVQSFKETFSVSPKFRGVNMTASLLLRSSASQGNVTVQFRDETNSVDYPSQQLQTNSQVIASLVTNSTTTVSGFSNSVINSLRIGMSVTGSGIPTGTTIASVNSTALTITLSQAATASATVSLRFSDLPRTIQLGFQIPANCSSYSYTISALQESGSPETYIDDVVLKNYFLGMSNQGQSEILVPSIEQQSKTFVLGGAISANNNVLGLSELYSYGSGIFSWDNITGTGTVLKSGLFNLEYSSNANTAVSVTGVVVINGLDLNADTSMAVVNAFQNCSWSGYLSVGETFRFRSANASSTNHRVIISATSITTSTTTVNDLVPAKAVLGNTSLEIPSITGWQGYTPTFQGFGSPTNVEFEWRQVGENVEIRGKFTSGTPTAVEARVGLPAGLTSADTSLIPSLQLVGYGAKSPNTAENTSILIEPSVSYFTFGLGWASGSELTKQNASVFALNGYVFSIQASVPCAGLSATQEVVVSGTQSALVQEEDSYLYAFGSTIDGSNRITTATLSNNIGSAFIVDTSAGYVKLKVSKNGIYAITFNADGTSSSLDRQAIIQLNGSNLSNQRDIGNGAGEGFTLTNTTTRYLTTDDFLTFIVTGSSSRNYNIQASYQGSLKQLNVSSDQKITIPTSELRFEGASARGTGTEAAIVQFTSLTKLRGDAFTIDNSNGTAITIRKSGKLDISASLRNSNGSCRITRNQAIRTALPTASETLAAESGVALDSNIAWSGFVSVGDIIRVCADNTPTSATGNQLNLSFQEQEIAVSVTNTLPQFSESDSCVRLDTANGYGSTATKIRRFSNVRENLGSDISYVDSAVDGASFTVRSAGIYHISYTDQAVGGTSCHMGITLNENDTTTNISTLILNSNNNVLAYNRRYDASGDLSNLSSHCGWSGYLQKGDVIRAHTNGVANVDIDSTKFTISKVGKPNVTGVDVTPFVNVPHPDVASYSIINSPNGFGSTYTQTPRFSSIQQNDGKGILSYTDSPTLGAYWTANKKCIATISLNSIYVAATAWSFRIFKNQTGVNTGTGLTTIDDQANTRAGATISVELNVGDKISFYYSSTGMNRTEEHVFITATALSDQILTAPESFSTDTASLSYASSAAYTLSTLQNAPVGTYITFTYAANTNTRTQTSTRPDQTDANMNVNGMQIFTRAYNAPSTAAQPAAIAIQIGKGLKGRSLDLYKSAGKVTGGDLDYYESGSGASGALLKAYNEVTGILVIDAGVVNATVTSSHSFSFADGSGQTSGYLVINASKSPALTGVPQLQPKVAVLKDEKANGTNAGAGSTSFIARNLNTLQDSHGIIMNSSSFTGVGGTNSQFTLGAGTYSITVTAPANLAPVASTTVKLKLRNVTDSVDASLGMSQCTGGGSFAQQFTILSLMGVFTITKDTVFEVQQRHSSVGDATQMGFAASAGVNEVYTQVLITKVK